MAKRKSFSLSSSLSKGLTDTVTAAKNYSGNLHVEVVPLRKIELDPENPRELIISFEDASKPLLQTDPLYEKKKIEIEALSSLVNSIKSQGVINPIIAYKYGENYKVVTGERRTLASILAGKQDIPVRILEQRPSAFDLSLLQWVENMEREDLSLWERLGNLEKISSTFAAQQGKNPREISLAEFNQILGCSPSQASHYRNLLDSSNKIKQAIKNNHIKNIEKAVFITKAHEKFEDQLIELCKKGLSLEAMKKALVELSKPKSKNVPFGRQATQVNFGTTKNLTASKVIIQSVLERKDYEGLLEKQESIDWNNYGSVTKAFKTLLLALEKSAK